jgi:pimeloyl-ACP methyl ester carboxylesterase
VTSYVTSRDGTRIAFDRLGDGPPVVVVSGTLCDRQTTRDLAEKLAKHLTVISYDRRGRGDSGDTPPYAVEREIEDLHALIADRTGPTTRRASGAPGRSQRRSRPLSPRVARLTRSLVA